MASGEQGEDMENALSCMLLQVQEVCKMYRSNILMQSGTDPERFIQREDIQTELGSYALFYAMVRAGHFDAEGQPGSGLKELEVSCPDLKSIDNFLFGNPNKLRTAQGKPVPTEDLPILRDALETAREIMGKAEERVQEKQRKR